MNIETLLSTDALLQHWGSLCKENLYPMQPKAGEPEIMGCQLCCIGAFHCLPTEHFQKNLEPRLPLAAAA